MTAPRLLLLVLFLAAHGVAAQPTPDLLQAIREATVRLDYATAEARAREALTHYDALTPDQLVEVHTTLGVLLAARAADVEARQQFAAALSLDPARTLDPVLVSPKTVELFEAVRAEMALGAASPAAPPGAGPTVRYIVLADPRPGAALRSAVLPGWGQIHRGDRRRGWAFAAGVGLAASGALAAHVAYAQARQDYGAAATPSDIDAAYDRANRLYRLRNGLAAGAALGWAASVAEALLSGGPRAPGGASPAASVAPSGLSLRIRL